MQCLGESKLGFEGVEAAQTKLPHYAPLSSVYVCFVDLAKVFDIVNRDVLWKLVRYYGVQEKITNLIRKFYEGFKAQIVHNGQLTEPFEMLTGVRQGCLFSPLVFLVVLDWVTRQAFGPSTRGIH